MRNSRTMTLLAAGVGGLTLFGLRPVQAQVAPGDIDKTQIRPSAHALGLGGSYLLLGDDPNGIISNPAAVAVVGSSGIDFAAEGQTNNVNISDVNHLVNSLKDLRDQINNTSNGSLAQLQSVEGSFNNVYNFAVNAGATLTNQAKLTASVSAGGAAKWVKIGDFSIGTTAYVGLAADVRLNAGPDNTPPPAGSGLPSIGNRQVIINGGALSLTNVGIPVAYRLPDNGGIVGLTPKYVRADYAAFTGNASESQDIVNGASYKEVNSSTFDLDAGYISPRFTVLPAPTAAPIALRGAFVVRHLVNPSFSLAKTASSTTNGFQAGSGNFNFSLSPEYDLGASAADCGVNLVAEVHNLSGANGGSSTFHVGAEYTVPSFPYVVPRIGYDNDRFVYGLGINIGNYVRLDAAASTNYQERAAADLSINFGF